MSEDTPVNVEVGFDFDRQFDQFDVTGMKTSFNRKGGIEDGYQYRWCRSDRQNLDRKKLREGYEIDLDPDTKAVYGNNDSKMGKHIEAYGEDYVLMKRPKAVKDAEREWMEKKRVGSIEHTNTYRGNEAVSQFMLKSDSPGRVKPAPRRGR